MCQVMDQAVVMQKGSRQVAALKVPGLEGKGWLVGRQTSPCSSICVMMGNGPFIEGAQEKNFQFLSGEVRQSSLEEAGWAMT